MLPDPSQHNVFTDFKSKHIKLGSIICFPPGTGGNFLATSISPVGRHLPNINEYLIDDGVALPLDSESTSEWVDLDKLHNLLLVASDKRSVSDRFGVSHNLPWWTWHIYTLQVEEILSLVFTHEDSWFPSSLNRIKWYLNKNWHDKPWLFTRLLEFCEYRGPVLYYEYELMCHTIAYETGVDMATGSILAWRWYMWCKASGKDFLDIKGFKRTVGEMIYPTLAEWHERSVWGRYGKSAISEYENRWLGRDYRDAWTYFQGRVPLLHKVDYAEFYFDLRRPDSGILSDIDLRVIESYSRSNIELIRQLLPLTPDRYQPELHDILGRYSDRLDRAMATLTGLDPAASGVTGRRSPS